MKRGLMVLIAWVAAASFFVACDDSLLTPEPAKPSAPPITQPSETDKPKSTTSGPRMIPTNNPLIKTVPPHAFPNHWMKTNSSSKSAKLQAFLSRKGRRMSLDKLEESVKHLLGVTWSVGGTNYFEKYALALGRADYIELNKSTFEINKLFVKLINDMAGNVCAQAVSSDIKETNENKRVFSRYLNDINKTLRFIRLKFHGVFVPETSTAEIAKLRKLYDDALSKSNKNRSQAWQIVCMATITSPEFFIY